MGLSAWWVQHYDVSALGGPHFIAACTGINLALLSWEQFQQKFKYADLLFQQRYAAASATIVDEQRELHDKFFIFLMLKLSKVSAAVWRIAYFFTILMAILGIWSLYVDKKCPYDFFLLLPSAIYLLWTYSALLLLICWIAVVKYVLKQLNDPNVEKSVREFTKRAGGDGKTD